MEPPGEELVKEARDPDIISSVTPAAMEARSMGEQDRRCLYLLRNAQGKWGQRTSGSACTEFQASEQTELEKTEGKSCTQ